MKLTNVTRLHTSGGKLTDGSRVERKRVNDGEKSISVIDYLGKTIWQNQSNFKQELDIDISKQAKGIYFVKVMMEGSTEVKKVIIM